MSFAFVSKMGSNFLQILMFIGLWFPSLQKLKDFHPNSTKKLWVSFMQIYAIWLFGCMSIDDEIIFVCLRFYEICMQKEK